MTLCHYVNIRYINREFKDLVQVLTFHESVGVSESWTRNTADGEEIKNPDQTKGMTEVRLWRSHYVEAEAAVKRMQGILDEIKALNLPESMQERDSWEEKKAVE